MSTSIIAIKRRVTGAPGAPAGLVVGELAYNQVNQTLYYGFSATTGISAIPIAGSGSYVGLTGHQQISGDKSFYGTTSFLGEVTFSKPVTFASSDMNFGKLTSYYSLSSLGETTLAKTVFAADSTVDATLAVLSVSTADQSQSGNIVASTGFTQTLVGTVSSTLNIAITATNTLLETVSTTLNSAITGASTLLETVSTTLNGTITAVNTSLISVSSSLNDQITGNFLTLSNNITSVSSALATSLVEATSGLANGLVTLNTDQSVSGVKTFTRPVVVSAPTFTEWSTLRTNGSANNVATLSAVLGAPLSLFTAAQAPSATVSFRDSNDAVTVRLTNVASPTADHDVATKIYVDAVAASLNIHQAVDFTTLAALHYAIWNAGTFTITGLGFANHNNKAAVGGSEGDWGLGTRVLVKNQSIAAQNGVYVVDTVDYGAYVHGDGELTLVRADDYNNSTGEISKGDFVFVTEGYSLANTGWVQTSEGTTVLPTGAKCVTVNSDPITFTQFSGAGQITGDNVTIRKDFTEFKLVTLTDEASSLLGISVDRYGRVNVLGSSVPNSLKALSAVTIGNGSAQLPLFTDTNTVSAVTVSDFGRSVLTSSANTVSELLALSSMSHQASGNVFITGGTITATSLSAVTFVDCVFDSGTF
jgi:hypothetical protein